MNKAKSREDQYELWAVSMEYLWLMFSATDSCSTKSSLRFGTKTWSVLLEDHQEAQASAIDFSNTLPETSPPFSQKGMRALSVCSVSESIW